jgi:peptidoglycan/LPS O-acetylase OafA/YrhL
MSYASPPAAGRNVLFDLDRAARFEASIPIRIGGLDELRGIAVLWVMASHGAGLLTWAPRNLGGWGMPGVLLFFFVSGYLITKILIASIGSPDYFGHFYIRRILRIWPLMLVAMLASAWLYPQKAALFTYNLGLTNNYQMAVGGEVMERTDVMWSLAIEEHFYLLWPLLLALVPSRWHTTLCLGLVTVGFVCSKGLFGYPHMTIHKTTHGNLHYLALGCGLAISRSFLPKSLLLLAVLFATWGVCCDFREWSYNMPTLVFNTIWVLFYVLVAQTLFGTFGRWRITSRWLAHLGKLCYGLYLIHFFVSAQVHDLCGPTPFLGFALYVGLSWALAWISYRFFEVPMQNLRTGLERRRTAGRTFLGACAVVLVAFMVWSALHLGAQR